MASSLIGEFLQARRARLSPADVGIRPAPGRRRVPGLRREELASLAGFARAAGTSPSRGPRGATPTAGPPSTQGVETRQHPLQQLVDLMDRVPALVLGPYLDVMAYNAAADTVFALSSWPSVTLNGAREVFERPGARERYPDWESLAEDVVAMLHLRSGRHSGDGHLATLVSELSRVSEDFRSLWQRHDVRQKGTGPVRVAHPMVGDLELTYRSLAAPGHPDDLLMTYTYEPASVTDERMRLLLRWSAHERAPAVGRLHE